MPISPETADLIRLKKSKYCRYADTNQFHLFHELMLPDAKLEFYESTGVLVNRHGRDYTFASRDEFTTFFMMAFSELQTIHVVGPGELEQTEEDEVKAVFGVVYHAGSKGAEGGFHGTGGGNYHEIWRRVEGDWFIADVRMKNLYWKVLKA